MKCEKTARRRGKAVAGTRWKPRAASWLRAHVREMQDNIRTSAMANTGRLLVALFIRIKHKLSDGHNKGRA